MGKIMGRPLSYDLRKAVYQAYQEGCTAREAGRRCGVAPATAVRWVARGKRGELAAKANQRNGSCLDPYQDFLLGLYRQMPSLTLQEIVIQLARRHGLSVCSATLSHWLRKRGYRRRSLPKRCD
ncbi:hypothetical protein [Bartonella sp. DGB2]|uniref:hypothetical protein n=1 Tax=Bartonella sp. DGB2 TaxID=3388426 RepID=UPI00398FC4AC